MALDYTTLWEAFASGQWTGSEYGALSDVSPAGGDQYGERVKSFYDVVIGPAFGYTDEHEGFGSAFGADESFFRVGQERQALDLAEREFRLAIGDPYGGADDPFAWENISRYKTYGTGIGEAQKLLEGELYDKGGFLGGETGSDYAISMEKTEETYTSGRETLKDQLTYGELTAGVGLASGTSGATLRSGSAISQAEDILAETYMTAKGIGLERVAERGGTETALRQDLDEALETYLGVIDTEKEAWYQGILKDVQKIRNVELQEEGDMLVASSFVGEKEFGAMEEEFGWEGLEYDPPEGVLGGRHGEQQAAGYPFRADDPDTPDIDESQPCGIGELFVKGEGCVPEGGLDENIYGQLYGTGEGLYYEIQGCTDSGACNHNPEAEVDDGSCEYETCADECGQAWGDNSYCTGCMDPEADNFSEQFTIADDSCTYPPEDECGVRGGTGRQVTCWDGSLVCSNEDCPPEEVLDDESYLPVVTVEEMGGIGLGDWGVDLGGLEGWTGDWTDTSLEDECTAAGMGFNSATGQCVAIGTGDFFSSVISLGDVYDPGDVDPGLPTDYPDPYIMPPEGEKIDAATIQQAILAGATQEQVEELGQRILTWVEPEPESWWETTKSYWQDTLADAFKGIEWGQDPCPCQWVPHSWNAPPEWGAYKDCEGKICSP